MKRNLKLTVHLLLGLVCFQAQAADITVPGDQATIEDAYAAAAASGDRIVITTAGTYEGAVFDDKNISLVNESGGEVTLSTRIAFNGAATSNVTIDGITITPESGQDSISFITGSPTVILNNCTMRGGRYGISGEGGDPVVTVTNCTFDTTQVGIVTFAGSGDYTVEDSVFDNPGNSAIWTQTSTELTINRCKFINVDQVIGAGKLPYLYIDSSGSSSNSTITNCVFDGGNTHFQNAGNGTHVIDHCTFGNTALHCVYNASVTGTVSLSNSIIWGGPDIGSFGVQYGYYDINSSASSTYNLFSSFHTAPYGEGTSVASAGTGDIADGFAAFKATGDDPFDINTTSDAIDAGDPASSLLIDILSRDRTGTPDIGAYEFIDTPNSSLYWNLIN